ncbi:MAG: ABC transporter permease [Chlorobi bacterium]|nr:ABC transporter permease [Chlorobiota bacterium]
MKAEWWIAKRYLWSKSGEGIQAVHYITAIAAAGVMLTVAALFVILSAFSGLRAFNMTLIDRTDPDLRILPREGKHFGRADTLLAVLNGFPGVKAVAAVAEDKALLRAGDKQTIVLVRGVDSSYAGILSPDDVLVAGQWPYEGADAMVAGQMLVHKLGINPGDPTRPVQLVIPGKTSKWVPSSSLVTHPFVVAGVYQLTPDAEEKYVFVPLDRWRALWRMPSDHVSFIDIRTVDDQWTERLKKVLSRTLSPSLRIADKWELNKAVLKMLNIENLFTYFTGFLFLLIAIFNIAGSIIILILKKKKDRFVLSALGMDTDRVRRIFFLYGNLLILVSGLAGLVLGIIIVLLQSRTGWIKVPGTFLAYPVEINRENLAAVLLTLVVVSYVASWLASRAVKPGEENL